MNPSVYVYHCATPHIPTPQANGMDGLIIIDPEQGLAQVDKAFYVVQGEFYTIQPKGTHGHHGMSSTSLSDERPNYVMFNGASAALTGDNAMHVAVGERVRLFVGNAVHAEGATEATSNIQTTLIPAGGAAWVEFTVEVPGTSILVDHALSRAINKGALAKIVAEGAPNPAVFDAAEMNMVGN